MTWISSVGKTSNRFHSLRSRQSGFTLIELVAVLVVIGLFLSLVTPFVMKTLDRIQSDSSVRKVVSMLAATRSRAVAAKSSFVFLGDFDQNQYWVVDPKTKKTSEVIQLDRTIQFQEFNDGETSWREGSFSVTFYPLGSTSGGTILLGPSDTEADAPSFVITLDPVTGKPYLNHVS